jgi:hypothetical protein
LVWIAADNDSLVKKSVPRRNRLVIPHWQLLDAWRCGVTGDERSSCFG